MQVMVFNLLEYLMIQKTTKRFTVNVDILRRCGFKAIYYVNKWTKVNIFRQV